MNTIAVLYTLFALPLYVAYDIPIEIIIIILEIFVSLLFSLNTYLKIKSFVKKARKTQNKKNILFELFFKTDVLFDLFASLPSFLVFSKYFSKKLKIINFEGMYQEEKDAITGYDLLKILRISQIFQLSSLIKKIQYEYRSLYNTINVMKSLVYLVVVIHWSACCWFWIAYKVEFYKKKLLI